MADQEAEITEDQATDALHEVMGVTPSVDETEQPALVPAEQPAPATQDAGTAETGAESVTAAPVEGEQSAEGEPAVTEAPADDVESLLARNKKLEEAATESDKRNAARVEALKQRNQQNEQIMRDRLLRKSTLSDKMAQTLRKSRSTEGVPEAEVEQILRDFEGSLNPASASYVAPQQAVADSGDQTLILNDFLNDKEMDVQEADRFGDWIKHEASSVMPESEQRVASQSLSGFLQLAHTRWQTGVKQKQRDDESKRTAAAGVARSVQQTQRAAARAASPVTAAPRTQPASPAKEPDYDKFTEGDVSNLLKESVRQYQ